MWARKFSKVNILGPRQNSRHLPDNIFRFIALNEHVWISIQISLTFVTRGPTNNIPALVQIMTWRRPRDKPLYGLMMVRLLMHICVTRPQWVNGYYMNMKPSWVSEWVIKFYGLSRTADSEVHIVHISRVIIACTLKSLSSPHIDNTQSTSYK